MGGAAAAKHRSDAVLVQQENQSERIVRVSGLWTRSGLVSLGLTWFTDSNLLQVRLLHVGKVLHARNVEAISHAQVVLLQLHVTQQLVEPLSVLVHQHDLPTLAAEGQRSLFLCPIYLIMNVKKCKYIDRDSICLELLL